MKRQTGKPARQPVGARHAVPFAKPVTPSSLSASETNNPRSPITPSPHHLITLVVLLAATLLLSGCAAGSPSVVAPVAPESSQPLVAEAPEAPPPIAAAPESVIPPDAPQPAIAAAPADIAASVPETLDSPDSESGSSAGAEPAAFAQEIPPVNPAPPEPAPADDEPAGVPAPAMQATADRPLPPPAPGDGTILDYYRGPSGRPEVALTFDAGADRGYGAEILDVLAAEGISATFGMTGKWAEENPDLIQRMVAEGHQLINHTWSHGSLTGVSTGLNPMTYEKLLQELSDTENLVRELTGYELKPYFRPPYGDIDLATSGYLAEAGYYVDVLWSCDSFGWNGFGADQIVELCTTAEQGGPGAIILMHVGADAVGDLEALPGLIDYYRSQGYAFVTVEQMLQP